MDSRFLLRWDRYNDQIIEAFSSLLFKEDLVDVTLSCEGKVIKAHKMLLSACSAYFHEIFKENPCKHPVIVFKNVQFVDLKAVVDFIYCGEVNVLQEQLESFLNTAEMLEVKGLTESEKDKKSDSAIPEEIVHDPQNSTIKSSSFTSAENKPDYSNSVAKKRKGNSVKSDKSPVPIKKTSVVKEEPEDVGCVKAAVTDPEIVPEDSSSKPKILYKEATNDPITPKSVEPTKELSKKDAEESEQHDKDESCMQETAPSDKVEESKNVPSPKKRKIVTKEETLKEREISAGGKIDNAKTSHREANLAQAKTVQIPKGLVVTTVPAQPVENLFDFPTEGSTEAVRSEDATTPVHEEMIQDIPDDAASGPDPEAAPEIAEEAPDLESEQTELQALEEEKEPEFDYFGCEICQGEAKPVDLERIVLNHKCPICPCACFCSHLLKEHMKVIHGWFNVQRRFTQY